MLKNRQRAAQAAAADALDNLTFNNHDSQLAIAAAGGIAVLLQLLHSGQQGGS